MLRLHAPEYLGHGLVPRRRRRRPPRPGRAGGPPQFNGRRGVDGLQLLLGGAGRRQRQARVVERAQPPRPRHRRAGRRRRVAQEWAASVACAVVVGVRRQGPVGRGDGVDGRGQVSLRFVGQARGRPGDAAELGAPARVRPQLGARLCGIDLVNLHVVEPPSRRWRGIDNCDPPRHTSRRWRGIFTPSSRRSQSVASMDTGARPPDGARPAERRDGVGGRRPIQPRAGPEHVGHVPQRPAVAAPRGRGRRAVEDLRRVDGGARDGRGRLRGVARRPRALDAVRVGAQRGDGS